MKQEASASPTTAAVVIDADEDDGECMAISDTSVHGAKPQALTADIGICGKCDDHAHQICCLLDTGSNVNLCSSALLKRMGCSSDMFTGTTKTNGVRLADGKNVMQQIGGVTLLCSTPSTKAPIKFIVVPTLAYDVVLGTSALTTLGIHICFSKGLNKPIVTSGHSVDVLEENGEDGQQDEAKKSKEEYWEQELNDGLLACGMSFEPIHPFISHVELDKTIAEEKDTEDDLNTVSFVDPLLISQKTPTKEARRSSPVLHQLPWATEDRPSSNWREALGRARSLERSLSLKEHISAQEALQSLFEEGHIELCEPEDINYYLPIHVVYKKESVSSATRLTVDGRKLNKYLRNGSLDGCLSLNHNLSVWRLSPTYVSLDLSRAFHAVKLSPKVRPFCGGYLYGCYFRWCSLPFGLCCSSSSLHQALLPILKSIPTDALIVWYVDDIGVTGKNITSLRKNETVVVQSLTRSGFTLQPKKRVSSIDSVGWFSHFGYNWYLDPQSSPICDDILALLPPPVKLLFEDKQLRLTKRQLLAAYATWYDSMGIFPSVGVRGRLNMQLANAEVTGWDDEVSPKHIDEFKSWCQAIIDCKPRVPRSLSGEYLFMFCDASEVAWSCVAYCPIYDVYHSTIQKDKPVQPLRGSGGVFGAAHSSWTIPKKELYSLFRACELLTDVYEAVRSLKINRSEWVLFSDSSITIYRIKSGRNDIKLSSLEARWVDYIRNTCIKLNVRLLHISSNNNLADAPSRGNIISSENFVHFKLSFLQSLLDGSALVEHCPNPIPKVGGSETIACAIIDDAATFDNAPSSEEDEAEETMARLDDFIGLKDVEAHQKQSTLYKDIRQWHEQGGHWSTYCSLPRSFLEREAPLYSLRDGILYRVTSVDATGVVYPKIALDHADKDFIYRVIDNIHHRMGHLGSDKFITLFEERYYCSRIKAIIKGRLKTCDPCQRIHAVRHHKKFWSRLRMKGLRPAQILAVDIMSMSTHGVDLSDARSPKYTCILTVTCAVSKYTWLRCLRSYTINEITKNLDILLGDIGYPVAFVFDGAGTQSPWTSKAQYQKLKAWAAKKAIKIAVLPPYAAGYAGWYEALHRFVRKALKADYLIGGDPRTWPERIPDYQLAMNGVPYSSQSSLCPLYLFYAYAGRLPCDLPPTTALQNSTILSTIDHLFNPAEQAFLTKLHEESVLMKKTQFDDYLRYWQKQKEVQQAALQRRFGAAQNPSFREGDMVLVYTPGQGEAPDFTGPYKIVEQLSDSTCRIEPVITQNLGGHGSRKDISHIQLFANLTRYFPRAADPNLTSWIQCPKCMTWHETDSLLVDRFRNTNSQFLCKSLGKRCCRTH